MTLEDGDARTSALWADEELDDAARTDAEGCMRRSVCRRRTTARPPNPAG